MKQFFKSDKYQPYPQVVLPNRQWPDNTLTQAPSWCSVDLRDGNQALINPMSSKAKVQLFQLLCQIGFKEIEIGFPAAADVEFDFTRKLIEDQLIPDDVTPQILCQARSHLIKKSFEALTGAKKAIFHFYNSTSTNQRKIVFKKDRAEIIALAVNACKEIKQYAQDCSTNITLQYSPESFTGTELEFSREICEAVMEVWQPTSDNKIILNLPATVELHTPNIHADQIEWFINNVNGREAYLLSLHPHNDRGTAVAATELALLAGADRVEGTLFGNGERTGNVDIVTLALNMYTQNIDPQLNFSNLNQIREIAEELTDLPVNPRHPYSGDLVFTAFSGSHQDAIKKGMEYQKTAGKLWEVPYIPIDPKDIGRNYQAIIRINSQSGKGGVAYVLEHEFGCHLPKAMHPEVSLVIQSVSEKLGTEVPNQIIWEKFLEAFVNLNTPVQLNDFSARPLENKEIEVQLDINLHGEQKSLTASGNGPIDAAKKALMNGLQIEFNLKDYLEHALESGSDSKAIAYIELENSKNKYSCFGAGIDTNTSTASIKALISALNRLDIF